MLPTLCSVAVVLSDTTRIQIVDTVGVVLPASPHPAELALSAASVIAALFAVVAAWKAATAGASAARAAEQNADAARLQAAAAAQQVEFMRESRQAALRQTGRALFALSKRLTAIVRELDGDAPKHKQLRNFALLTEVDIHDLERLARDMDNEAVIYAGKAVLSMHALLGLIKKARSINEGTGWLPSDEEIKRWRTAHEAGLNMLEKMAEAGKHAAAFDQ